MRCSGSKEAAELDADVLYASADSYMAGVHTHNAKGPVHPDALGLELLVHDIAGSPLEGYRVKWHGKPLGDGARKINRTARKARGDDRVALLVHM